MNAGRLQAITIKPTAKHSSSVIFLHGLGDSGHGWSEIGRMFSHQLPGTKWIFPHSPERPITINGGSIMPGWYDIYSLDKIASKEDEAGMLHSKTLIESLIHAELDAGIPNHRVFLGGFSQGAAMSLLTGLSSKIKLGGFVILSGYLPLVNKINEWAGSANTNTPIFMAHGDEDQVVSFKYGKDSADLLKKRGNNIDFQVYKGLGHSSSNEELSHVVAFLSKHASS